MTTLGLQQAGGCLLLVGAKPKCPSFFLTFEVYLRSK
jgi:hypothetical protein